MRSYGRTDVRVAVRTALFAAMACGAGASLADQAEQTPTARVEEVIVTAQRREQNIQDVGIAVTPLGEKAL